MSRVVRTKFMARPTGEAVADVAAGREGPTVVHVDGAPLGEQTLCGHVDRTDCRWEYADDAPTCAVCLSIWTFVKQGRLPAARGGR